MIAYRYMNRPIKVPASKQMKLLNVRTTTCCETSEASTHYTKVEHVLSMTVVGKMNDRYPSKIAIE